MLRDVPKIFLIMLFGIFLTMVITYYSMKAYEQDSSVRSIQETLRTSAISNRDDSARVERGRFILFKDEFEKDFKTRFKKGKNLTNKTTKYIFEYLTDAKDGIKAIKVKVTSGNKEYQGTCILDISDS